MKEESGLWNLFRRKKDKNGRDFNHLNSVEKDMIQGIVELSDTTVRVVMVPRIDVVSVEVETSQEKLLGTLIECGHSRVPVYSGTIDNVVGILYVKDLLPNFLRGITPKISEIMRKPYFVPESKKLDSLLRDFRNRRVHIALVVDEYGGFSGIVCMEDIIEEIVGDIQDEFDNEEEDILEIGTNTYLCDARVGIIDFNKVTGLEIADDDFDTLGGYVFDSFGKIPVRGEKVEVPGVELIIHSMDGHKIKTIKVVKLE